jgi:cell pole-organizing protein PopZ
MTKSPIAAEPSMEDILASIRKMISEERLGPRPLPDQMARTPFGDGPAAAPRARPASLDPQPETTRAPAERSVPSFSSLSDALKAATSSSERRRTLDEKIADMLEKSSAPADTLAVFSANRPSSAQRDAGSASGGTSPARRAPSPSDRETGPDLPARGAGAPLHRQGPASRAADAPLSGAAPQRELKPLGLGNVVPPRDEPPAAHGEDPDTRPFAATTAIPKVVRSSIGEPRSEPQRIISMPTRLGSASGAGPAGSVLNGQPMNGATVAPFGFRPASAGTHAARPASGADTIADETAKAEEPSPASAPTSISTPASTASLKGEEAEAAAEDEIAASAEAVLPVAPAEPGDGPAAREAAAAHSLVATEQAPEPLVAKPAHTGGPSEALLDAVVDLVHNEPSALSVFTSGAAFIHGVGSEGIGTDKPHAPRKLDGAAAELLRPMLRQWLADNMPRIVEEALRSELKSSIGAAKGPDKA